MAEPNLDLLPISALQHLLFCERQCALIHIERVWAENRLTVEGQHLHRKAHDGPDELRDDVRHVRGLQLRSDRLGLVGVADVVAFPRDFDLRRLTRDETGSGRDEASCGGGGGDHGGEDHGGGDQEVSFSDTAQAEAGDAPPLAYPIEYKRGRPKTHDADRVQLCAQALCLEEMLGVPGKIREGALFYGRTRRRELINFDEHLRRQTESAAQRLSELFASGITPKAQREPKCDNCSLERLCLPDAMKRQSAQNYLVRALRQMATKDVAVKDQL